MVSPTAVAYVFNTDFEYLISNMLAMSNTPSLVNRKEIRLEPKFTTNT